MKRTAKKICLSRETLCNLSASELEGAEGAGLTPACGIQTIYISCGCVPLTNVNRGCPTGFDCTKFC